MSRDDRWVNYGIAHTGKGDLEVTGTAVGPGATVFNTTDPMFTQAIGALADQIAQERAEVAASLRWLQMHASAAEEPADARDHVGAIKRAGSWLWDRFTNIIDASATTIAPWLLTLVHNVARW